MRGIPTTLEALVERLSRHEAVDGIVFVGSTASGKLRDSSDYDVLLVLDKATPLLVGLTTVEGRLTDLLFYGAEEVDRVLKGVSVPPDSWPARLTGWVANGKVVFDRTGRLARLRNLVMKGPSARREGSEPYAVWFSLNYDLAQNRRLAGSRDPVDGIALQLRVLRGIYEAVHGYFDLRGMEWKGEKAAVRHLREHDGGYFEAVDACLRENNTDQRTARYEALVERTLVPFGGTWVPGSTVFQFRPGIEATPDLVLETRRFWESIIAGCRPAQRPVTFPHSD